MRISWKAVFRFFGRIFKSKFTKMNERFELATLKYQIIAELSKLQTNLEDQCVEEFCIERKWRNSLVFCYWNINYYEIQFKTNNDNIVLSISLIEENGTIQYKFPEIKRIQEIKDLILIAFLDGTVMVNFKPSQNLSSAVKEWYRLIPLHAPMG